MKLATYWAVRGLFMLAALGALAGCQTPVPLTAAQQAAIFCVISADGTALAIASTKGGAAATAKAIQDASVVACDAATKVGAIVAPPSPK